MAALPYIPPVPNTPRLATMATSNLTSSQHRCAICPMLAPRHIAYMNSSTSSSHSIKKKDKCARGHKTVSDTIQAMDPFFVRNSSFILTPTCNAHSTSYQAPQLEEIPERFASPNLSRQARLFAKILPAKISEIGHMKLDLPLYER